MQTRYHTARRWNPGNTSITSLHHHFNPFKHQLYSVLPFSPQPPYMPFIILYRAVFPEQNTGKRKRGERSDPLWFMPNNTYIFYISLCICVCVCVFVRLCVSLCIVVNCSDPGIPANSIRQSKIEHGNFTFGTVVFYDCNPGYYLFGSPVLTCQPTGQWDKPLPECIG